MRLGDRERNLYLAKVEWTVTITRRAQKRASGMSERAQQRLAELVKEIIEKGPVRGNWPHYQHLHQHRRTHHCHLAGKRPLYVACWRQPDHLQRHIEVYYAGTHEDAPY